MFESCIQALEKIDTEQIRKIAELLYECAGLGGRIFIAGNGGSHSIAQHLTSDLMKAVGVPNSSCKAICMTDNVALITALSNDSGYEHIFSAQADWHGLNSSDVVICFSVSGTSPNIRSLINRAYNKHALAIMITGNPQPSGEEHAVWLLWLIHNGQYMAISSGHDRKSPMHYYVCESVFSCIAHAIANEFHILRGNYSAEEQAK